MESVCYTNKSNKHEQQQHISDSLDDILVWVKRQIDEASSTLQTSAADDGAVAACRDQEKLLQPTASLSSSSSSAAAEAEASSHAIIELASRLSQTCIAHRMVESGAVRASPLTSLLYIGVENDDTAGAQQCDRCGTNQVEGI